MKILRCSQTIRFYFDLFVLLMIIVIAGIGVFRASASNDANESSTKGEVVSVQLKSQNTAAVNLRPGRDLPTTYNSRDYSSNELKGGQNRPLALASADFDVDGFPDLVSGYSAPSGGGILHVSQRQPESLCAAERRIIRPNQRRTFSRPVSRTGAEFCHSCCAGFFGFRRF